MTGDPQITPVRMAHRIDEVALSSYLEGRLPGFSPPFTLRQFEGGQSNPTYLIDAGGRRWVLRKKPPGKLLPSAHQVGREHRVLEALKGGGVPAPTPRLHCTDETVIGTEFFVMDWVAGRVFQDPLLPELSPSERRALYLDLFDVLARLHAIDPASVGLSDFGKTGNYFARQIARWSGQYVASQTDDLPDMTFLMAWLPEHIPGDDRVSIVHGDYTVRNCIVAPDAPRIAAVLDWELSTLGHPLADVAHACLFYFGDTGADAIAALGVPSLDELRTRYLEAIGHGGQIDWTFYMAFALFRIAAINQGVYRRGLDGNAASENFLLVRPSIARLSARACALIRDSGAIA
jgi:aminoglycoside phosphotransferase (APT) family kinase protein